MRRIPPRTHLPLTKRLAETAFAVVLTLVIAVTGFPFPVASAQETGDMKSLGYIPGGIEQSRFTFILATDSHLGAYQGTTGTAKAMADIGENCQDAAFMIHMGDITETGSRDEYDLFEQYIAPLPFPVFPTMGNHESRWQDRQGTVFAQHFGPKNYSFDYGLWHFVVLDTTSPGQTVGTLDPAVVAWLEEDLAAQPGQKPVAIFGHHPFCYEPVLFQDSDDVFLDLLDRYPVRVVFSGHGHSFISWKAQGRDFEMVGALMDRSYGIIDIDGTEMSIHSVTEAGTSERSRQHRLNVSGVPKPSPISDFVCELRSDALTGSFHLSENATVSYQIDRGGHNSLGYLSPGAHQFSCNVSSQPKGKHTIRIKATTQEGPHYAYVEWDKEVDGFLAWRLDLGSACVGNILEDSPTTAILGTRDGMIRKIRLKDGAILWEHRAGSAWGGGAVQDGRLFFGTAEGHLFCLNAQDGTLIWRTSPDKAGFPAPPLLADTSRGKSVILGSSSGTLYSVNMFTGMTLWKFQAGGALTSTPATGEDKVYFGAWDGCLYAVDSRDGTQVWQKTLGRQIYYSPSLSPTFSSGKVFATTLYDGVPGASYLHALCAATGDEIWKYSSAANLFGTAAPPPPWPTGTAALRLAVLDGAGNVLILSQRDGKVVSKLEGHSSLFPTFAWGRGLWATGGSRGVLRIITSENSTDIKIRDTFLMQGPLLTDDLVVQSDSKGTVWGIALPK